MKKYAVLVSNENGDRPNFEAIDVALEEAVGIASGGGRVDCRPIGRADRSFASPSGVGLVWSVVPSTKNPK